MKFNLIGAGRLGKALAFAMTKQGATLQAVVNARLQSAQQAVADLGMGKALSGISELKPAELTLITVPDDQIKRLANQLAASHILAAGSVVIHCSGVLNSQVLLPLANQGIYTASVHPLQALGGKPLNANCFEGCPVAIEGDPQALDRLFPLLLAMGAKGVTIDSHQKSIYHAAAVFAANYLVTLHSKANELFQQAGINSALAKEITIKLMQSSLDNLKQQETASEALTGPLARGDLSTIETHLEAITDHDTLLLYKTLGTSTLPLTHHDESTLTAIKQLLATP